MKVLHVSTFVPERCGIARYSEDLIHFSQKIDRSIQHRVMALRKHIQPGDFGDLVIYHINREDKRAYRTAADFVNNHYDLDIVNLQHEFGIFGGENGNFILEFLQSLKKPVVTTYHSVDMPASKSLKKIYEDISRYSMLIVCISHVAKKILVQQYGIDKNKISVFHHGLHDFPESREYSRDKLNLKNNIILSTVGSLRESKGIEYVLRALPSVVTKYKNLLYIIAGSTFPDDLEGGRDLYREFLEGEVERFGIKNHVAFVNRYLSLEDLLRYINASDICMTPYTFPDQVSSGILSFCVGLKKPVISSPFLFAKEILQNGRGELTEFQSPESISNCIQKLLENQNRIKEIKERLTSFREHMRWEMVAKKYIRLWDSVRKKD